LTLIVQKAVSQSVYDVYKMVVVPVNLHTDKYLKVREKIVKIGQHLAKLL